jgi:hypothetical protein
MPIGGQGEQRRGSVGRPWRCQAQIKRGRRAIQRIKKDAGRRLRPAVAVILITLNLVEFGERPAICVSSGAQSQVWLGDSTSDQDQERGQPDQQRRAQQ